MTETIYTARCFKCKVQKEVKDPRIVTTKKGTNAVTGVCPVCSTKMFKFVGKTDSMTSTEKIEDKEIIEKQTVATEKVEEEIKSWDEIQP